MKISAVSTKKVPQYPSLEFIVKNPEILNKRIPAKWYQNEIIAGAISAFVLFNSCDNQQDIKAENKTENIFGCNKSHNNHINNIAAKIAPIFVHGDGSGATGCVVIAPPVFISEDEARKIIINELNKAGFEFDTTKVDYNITFKSKQIAVSCISEEERDKMDDIKVNFRFDAIDKNKNFVFEYVSVPDFEMFADDLWGCSVSEYDTKRAAGVLRDELIKKDDINAVVFYDPIVTVNYDDINNWEDSYNKGIEESKKLLVAQVADFINWAKNEGILK